MCPPTLTFEGCKVLLINLLPCTPVFPFLAPWQVPVSPDPLYQGWVSHTCASLPSWPCSGLDPHGSGLSPTQKLHDAALGAFPDSEGEHRSAVCPWQSLLSAREEGDCFSQLFPWVRWPRSPSTCGTSNRGEQGVWGTAWHHPRLTEACNLFAEGA